MEQIPQSIINSILGGALAALGWFADDTKLDALFVDAVGL